MLEILAAVVEEPIINDIQSSVAIGLEVDESMDVCEEAARSSCRVLT